ncbi:MAG: hypothetical protein ACRDLL_05510 [Solirubrobacterales bacterium]
MAIAAILIVGLGAAGCGSSSSSSSSSSTTTSTTGITKTEFLVKANAICTVGNKVLNKVGAKLGKSPSQAQVTAVVKAAYAPSIQGQINGIRALGAPAGDEATVTNMLDLAQADLNKLKSDPTLLVKQNDTFANFAKIAHPYGLTKCAAGS